MSHNLTDVSSQEQKRKQTNFG